ncbi:MAG: hypothetical protein ACE5GC_01065 [Acidimicrobiia bacterium]
METTRYDPYRHCERGCHHDLATGVLVSDLLGEEGPYPPLELVWQRAGRGWVAQMAAPEGQTASSGPPAA